MISEHPQYHNIIGRARGQEGGSATTQSADPLPPLFCIFNVWGLIIVQIICMKMKVYAEGKMSPHFQIQ